MSATKAAISTKDLFIEALSLPARPRAELAHKLLVSLESEKETAEIEAAWDEEAKSRYDAYKSGKLKARDAAEGMREAYKRLK
jgi:putative addiction module component (TIGR02574 family)